MSKTTLQILKDARELISDPSRWTQFEEARDAEGVDIDPCEEGAVCWCSVGAIFKVNKAVDFGSEKRAFERLYEASGAYSGRALAHFNDTRNHADVLAMFDRAIASEERRAAE